jgi:hypothetical protein
VQKTIFKQTHGQKLNLEHRPHADSTLLIPLALVKKFKRKSHLFGGIPRYFQYVMRQYRLWGYGGNLDFSNRAKIEYQAAGQQLRKFNFAVDINDWVELGQLAIVLGKSRTHVFSILLDLDLKGWSWILRRAGFKPGVPRLSVHQLQVSIRQRRRTSTRVRYFRSKYAGALEKPPDTIDFA